MFMYYFHMSEVNLAGLNIISLPGFNSEESKAYRTAVI